MEIARSGNSFLEALPQDDLAVACDILQDLLSRIESPGQLIPVELLQRILALITGVTCFMEHIDIGEIQLRLLRFMDSCDYLSTAFDTDLALLHFQRKSDLMLL